MVRNTKKGVLYSQFKKDIRPFDLVFFRGGEFISDLIRFAQRRLLNDKLGKTPLGEFSHIGMVVSSEILDSPLLEDGKLYLFESTMGGKLGKGIADLEGKNVFGVQLRELDEVIKAYDDPEDTLIAIAHLLDNPLEKLEESVTKEIKRRFSEVFATYQGLNYDYNLISIGSSILKCCRPCRSRVEKVFETEDWVFCSELIAKILKDMKIIPALVNPKNVVPMDFLGQDADTEIDGGLPAIVQFPLHYVVSDKWASKATK